MCWDHIILILYIHYVHFTVIHCFLGLANLTISVSPANAVKQGTPITLTANLGQANDGSYVFVDDVYFLWHFSNNVTKSGTGSDMVQIAYNFAE